MNKLCCDIDLTYYRKWVMCFMRILLAFVFIKAGMGKWPIVNGEGVNQYFTTIFGLLSSFI